MICLNLAISLCVFVLELNSANGKKIGIFTLIEIKIKFDRICINSWVNATIVSIFLAGANNLKNFAVNCEEGHCVCKGFPDPNVKEALLRGKVSLEKCRQACTRRNLCFGFEFWTSQPGSDSANCFECPTFPGKTYSISVVTNVEGHNNWATVYTKATKPPEEIDPNKPCIH